MGSSCVLILFGSCDEVADDQNGNDQIFIVSNLIKLRSLTSSYFMNIQLNIFAALKILVVGKKLKLIKFFYFFPFLWH